MMKKLLLVALVPLLVLGFVGCGKVFEGDTTPAQLQGLWANSDGTSFSVTGNQISVFRTYPEDEAGSKKVANNAYRTTFSGNENLAGDLTFEFHAFEKPGALVGSIVFTYSAKTITVKTLSLEQAYQTYMLPPEGTYTKLEKE